MAENIPVFAILGHPNEGKSSVVATLAEDDAVRISPTPGETRKCREYPVVIDGREVIRFVDTPGFQQPRKSLAWMQQYRGPETKRVPEFIAAHKNDPDFADECELLSPVARGAGIIFVTDGSRPVRNSDIAEMEILRQTAAPRMAVINPKDRTEHDCLARWKAQARKHFNTIRIFDAQQANYSQRMELLHTLKIIDPDWEKALGMVTAAFRQDWEQRLAESAAIIVELIEKAAGHRVKKYSRDVASLERIRQELAQTYRADIHQMEADAHKRIKKRFKHNIFNLELPQQSIVHDDLFSSRTWKFLGLSRWQLATAAGAGGGIVGAKIDLALAGLSFGVFTALGGVMGAGSAALGTERMAKARLRGLPLGRAKIRVGPARADQLLFILIDRALIYFSHVINWAHSRRDKPRHTEAEAGYTASWSTRQKQDARRFFKAVRKQQMQHAEELKPRMTE
ncbi:MAG TPA: GTPase/DUF3482 domain-containing protein, partial [Desulfosalsimonadaceae bacterium]|nr:GTPase/DUF3482 domain-containing protein [Desulfosalsimonadaceae bacterium]